MEKKKDMKVKQNERLAGAATPEGKDRPRCRSVTPLTALYRQQAWYLRLGYVQAMRLCELKLYFKVSKDVNWSTIQSA